MQQNYCQKLLQSDVRHTIDELMRTMSNALACMHACMHVEVTYRWAVWPILCIENSAWRQSLALQSGRASCCSLSG